MPEDDVQDTGGLPPEVSRRLEVLETSNRALLGLQSEIEKLVAFQSRMSLIHSPAEICDIAFQALGELQETIGSAVFKLGDGGSLDLLRASDDKLLERIRAEVAVFENESLLEWIFNRTAPAIMPSGVENLPAREGPYVMFAPLQAAGSRVGLILSILRRGEDHVDGRVLKLNAIFANQLGLSLANAGLMAQVRDYNQRLSDEVDRKTRELKNQNARLESLVDELRGLDRMKDNFLSTVSHELRTPMTAIRGSLGLVLGGAAGSFDQKVGQMLDITHRNTDRLLRLINSLLDLGRIEQGRMELHLEQVDLAEVARHVADEIAPFAGEHDVTVEVELCGEASPEADRDKLVQVIHNLVSNGIKFSPGGTVTIRVSTQQESAVIDVIDTGIGISPENLENVFQKFFQVEQDMNRSQEGSGLGLAITRGIVEVHGGTVDVTSTPGHGSTFTVRLPMARAERSDAAA